MLISVGGTTDGRSQSPSNSALPGGAKIYDFSKTMRAPSPDAVPRVIDALKAEGIGMITEINVMKTLRNKIKVELRNHRILGAWNPNACVGYEMEQPDMSSRRAAIVRRNERSQSRRAQRPITQYKDL